MGTLKTTLTGILLALALSACSPSAMLGGLLGSFVPPGQEEVTERTPYIAAAEAFELVRDSLKILGEREILTLDQLNFVDPMVQATNVALNNWDAQLREAAMWRKAGLPEREAAALAEANHNATLAEGGISQLTRIKMAADLPPGDSK